MRLPENTYPQVRYSAHDKCEPPYFVFWVAHAGGEKFGGGYEFLDSPFEDLPDREKSKLIDKVRTHGFVHAKKVWTGLPVTHPDRKSEMFPAAA